MASKQNIDYDGMGNQGRFPESREHKIIQIERYVPIALALIALIYSVILGLLGYTEEAQYSANWPGTILLFTIAINQIKKL